MKWTKGSTLGKDSTFSLMHHDSSDPGLICLKVKCNEIWTIFLLLKNVYKKVSCTDLKQNQVLKISFLRIVAFKTQKSDDFRELQEYKPEKAAFVVETNYRYLWCQNWQAYFQDYMDFLEIIELPQRFSGIYCWTNLQNRSGPQVLIWKCPIQPCKFKLLESGNNSVNIRKNRELTIWLGEPFWIHWKLLFKDK